MTSTDRLLAIATAARAALEDVYPYRRLTLRNLCGLASCAVVSMARKRHIPADVMGGVYRDCAPAIAKPQFGNVEHIAVSRIRERSWPHAWVRTKRNYLDITLTQFDPCADVVAVLPFSDRRYHGTVEELGFVIAVLPVCGSTQLELCDVVERAERILLTQKEGAA
jgi:hypothetical protein